MRRFIILFIVAWMLVSTASQAQNTTYEVITPENVQRLEQIGTLGHGFTLDVRYLDNQTIETVSYGGLWRYDADNLSLPPQWDYIPLPDHTPQYSPDGHWMLTDEGQLWDVDKQEVVTTFDTFSERAEFSQDSQLLAYYQRTIMPESDVDCLADNSCLQKVILWDTSDRNRRLTIIETDITDVALVANDTLLAVMQNDQTVFYDAATGNQAFVLPVRLRDFSPDGSKGIASYVGDENNGTVLQVWDLALQIVTLNLTFLPEETLAQWAFNPDSTLLAINSVITDKAAGDVQGTIAVWDIAALNRAATFPHDEFSFGFAFSPDNRYLATVNYPLYDTSNEQITLTLFDLQTFRIQASIPNDLQHYAYAIAFRPDSTQLAIAYTDGRLQTVDPRTGEITADIAGYPGYLVDVTFTDAAIMTSSDDAQTFLWHPETLAPTGRYDGCNVLAYQATTDRALCFRPYTQNTIPEIRYLTTGETWATLPDIGENSVIAAVFRSDGDQIATLTDRGTLQLWDTNTGALQRILQESTSGMTNNIQLTYLPNGQYLAAGEHGTIWNVETGAVVNQIAIEGTSYGDFAISEAGDWLAQAVDSTLYIWRLSALLNGQPATVETAIATLRSQNNDDPLSMAYGVLEASPDGYLLAARTPDSIVLIEAETLTMLHTIPDTGRMLRFSPDGTKLIIRDGYCYLCLVDESPQIGYARVWAIVGG